MKYTYLFIILSFLLLTNSCSDKEGFKLKFKDNFESGLQEFWKKEIVDSTKLNIVNDPLNKNNKVLQIKLSIGDKIRNGFRSEIYVKPFDPINSVTKYSFKFLLPSSFFKKNEKKSWIIIHQWHDYPPYGYSWSDMKKTNPPYNLFIQHNPNGDYYLVYSGGMRIGGIDERSNVIYKEKLKPNHWYTFENEIKWHVKKQKSYCKPKLDGELFSNKRKLKIYTTRNMYNESPNSCKIGLYWDGSEQFDRIIYFDDFILKSKD